MLLMSLEKSLRVCQTNSTLCCRNLNTCKPCGLSYHIFSNKLLGNYFLQGLQDVPGVKRDRVFIRGPALISNRLFRGTVDLRRSLIAAHLHGL